MSQQTRPFGTLPDGREVTEHLLGTGDGPQLRLLDLGAAVHGFRLRGDDPTTEVVVGQQELEHHQQASSAYFGAVVGRYANRIAHASFELDGVRHELTANEGTTALHGGVDGFSFRTWQVSEQDDESITFTLVSPDGDQGFPGTLTATATYRVLADGFSLELAATTDQPTICALTSHTYLNLAGGGSVDEHSIPLGERMDVTGTPFDLRQPTPIREAVRTEHPQILAAKGIDHSYEVNGNGMRPVATLRAPREGRTLTLHSDQPALQVYTGNFLDGLLRGGDGRLLRQGDAIALEPHQHPDGPNQDWGGQVVLRPGETWTSRILWSFA